MTRLNLKLVVVLAVSTIGITTAQGDGWVQWTGNGHYYKAVSVLDGITWTDAQAAATDAGGYLATITSQPENNFVYSLADSPQFWNYADYTMGPWLGGYQDKLAPDYSEPWGAWRWVTGEPFSYTNWYPGEPNDGPDENYLHFSGGWDGPSSSGWNDATANGTGRTVKGYIIESSVPEPSTLLLLGVGAIGLVAWASRRRPRLYNLSAMILIASLLIVGTCSQSSYATVVADSASDFSSTQGANNRFYGFYSGTLTPRTFQLLPSYAAAFSEPSYPTDPFFAGWSNARGPGGFWTIIYNDGGVPNGTNGNWGRSTDEQWAVRRWSSDVDSQVTIDLFYGPKEYTPGAFGGLGMTVLAYVDGVETFRRVVGDAIVHDSFNAVVHSGSTVDFVVATDENHADVSGWVTYTTQINTIPEPSTLVLLGIGAVSLVAYGWRRQKS